MLLKKPNMLNTYRARRGILVFLWNGFNPKKLSLKKNGLLVVPGPDVLPVRLVTPLLTGRGLRGTFRSNRKQLFQTLGVTYEKSSLLDVNRLCPICPSP